MNKLPDDIIEKIYFNVHKSKTADVFKELKKYTYDKKRLYKSFCKYHYITLIFDKVLVISNDNMYKYHYIEENYDLYIDEFFTDKNIFNYAGIEKLKSICKKYVLDIFYYRCNNYVLSLREIMFYNIDTHVKGTTNNTTYRELFDEKEKLHRMMFS